MTEDKYSTPVKPEEIHLHTQEKCLEVSFENGKIFKLPAEYLRVESPSAEVQGHGVGPKKLIAGRKFVGIMNIEPIGNYAIKIIFDDMHDSGLYSWRYLYQLGEEYEVRWEQYLADLKAEGKRREP
ncbi:gamma-butyrobetaine hydroxylase-like domain-containing protein [Curvivirga sp.]|uniref:gamma-butyrobetaine hydroxylase-like domain-containing protein n=1 Tax=Curvivirga sp. TaxID=2856848 RepID=UPI003B5A61AC